ncbi:uncharacterized protein LOC131666418 [Phymastichus coffea]|uniref:uncharacterized protein LOC131666418 n=1 Tax=Phymastichus coffea TaxID=108790 RepID=UPI00273B0C7A|nr:uncharacterized protein LOC131666418 [Phymastichus coffea]
MLKYSTHILVIAVAIVWAQTLYTKVQEKNLLQDAAVNFAVHSWKERADIPESYNAKAIEQIKALKNQEWKGLGNFFFQLLDISEDREKVAGQFTTVNPETNNNNDESMVDIIKELFIEILLTGTTSSEASVLEKEFKDAIQMKFKSIDDFGQYCIRVFEEFTGRTSPNER